MKYQIPQRQQCRGATHCAQRLQTPQHMLSATTVARVIAALALVYTAYYLHWRARYSLNTDALWFSLPLLLAEVHGTLNFILFYFMTWDVRPIPRPQAPPGRTVDIFIPTYNEDLSILRMTILGALNVRYPHETWVLDDGRRPALRALCDEMGVHYLTRPDNTHHKAGNINAALAQTGGEFVAIFDADQIPLPDFLDQTLGYFVDDSVAFVQTPQEFYNLDSVQHKTDWRRGETWHEQALFYNVIQPGKNRWNAAFWCGSNSVMRRAALLSAGGIATETVTEDIHTSLRLPGNVACGSLFVRSCQPLEESKQAALWFCGGPFIPDSPAAAGAIDEYLISIMARQMQFARAGQGRTLASIVPTLMPSTGPAMRG